MDTHNLTAILIRDRDAASLLCMPRSRIVRLANRGVIPCVRLPDGERRYHPDDLRAWVDQHRHLPPEMQPAHDPAGEAQS